MVDVAAAKGQGDPIMGGTTAGGIGWLASSGGGGGKGGGCGCGCSGGGGGGLGFGAASAFVDASFCFGGVGGSAEGGGCC